VHDTPQAKAQPASMLRDKLKHRVEQHLNMKVRLESVMYHSRCSRRPSSRRPSR